MHQIVYWQGVTDVSVAVDIGGLVRRMQGSWGGVVVVVEIVLQ